MSAVSVLPTLYEYYAGGGVQTGLTADTSEFRLNGKNITLYSGAMHYFRVPRAYWRDRLRKMRAAGLNTVETYVPWNLHEPEPGKYDWGNGGTDMQDFLHLEEFLNTAKEEDLLAIVRPGPYICSEWEFGGFPSWLLREKDIQVRTSDEKFMKHVRRYFNVLLPMLSLLQFTKGGPVVAFQIENEYGSTEEKNKPMDKPYLNALKDLMINNGIGGLFVTSDSPTAHGDKGSVPGALQTANFQTNPENEFDKLQELQPGKPKMAMEYWTGWFDHWTEEHHIRTTINFENVLKRILDYPASVNMYMFTGGTNWGFLNGANINDGSTDNKGYQPDVTSYDYDAPLAENGDYTEKYVRARKVIMERYKVELRHPHPPQLLPRIIYPSVEITERISFEKLTDQVENKVISPQVLPMELLDINNKTGQSYGYIVYKKINLNIPANAILKIQNRVCDTVMVLINGVLKSGALQNKNDLNGFGYWKAQDSTLNLGPEEYEDVTLELVVENWGRNNFGSLQQFKQHKGLWQGNVSINDEILYDWQIIPLEFKKSFMTKLVGWQPVKIYTGPALYRGKFSIDKKQDTYLDMRTWVKGIVIVNGFVLGRHAIVGPQMMLYLPAPLLNEGGNEIIVFEHFKAPNSIKFAAEPKYTSRTTRNAMI